MSNLSVSVAPVSPIRKARKTTSVRTHASQISKSLGVVDQVRIACKNPLPTVIGALIGALVPFATYQVAHHDLNLSAPWSLPMLLVVGGLVYSATTVAQWGRLAFASWYKAVGFTVLVEGIMVGSGQEWLSVVALCYLCTINAIATGVTLTRGSRIQGTEPQSVSESENVSGVR